MQKEPGNSVAKKALETAITPKPSQEARGKNRETRNESQEEASGNFYHLCLFLAVVFNFANQTMTLLRGKGQIGRGNYKGESEIVRLCTAAPTFTRPNFFSVKRTNL